MDTPVQHDMGQQCVDFNGTSRIDQSQGKLAEFAHEKTRQRIDVAGFYFAAGACNQFYLTLVLLKG